jgi:enoyl-CoA hydratase
MHAVHYILRSTGRAARGPVNATDSRPARMPYSFLTLTVANRIANVTINRPDKLNALNATVIDELADVIDQVQSRDDIGGVILTGAGRAFVAGADIGELSALSPIEARRHAMRGQEVFRLFEISPKPVIAAINGFALGGGCELAMACHIRIASEHAKFGQPETKLGIGPGYGGTQRLPRLVGRGRAIQLILTGEMIDAAEAYRIGLVNRLVPAGDLLAAAEAMMSQILANAPLAVGLSIDAVDRGTEMSLEEGLALEASHFGLLVATQDVREGMKAFLEKRPPRFGGR